VPTCWWHCTSPQAPFAGNLLTSRVTGDGRVTIAGNRLIRSTDAGDRDETQLAEGDLVAAYKSCFGIELDAPPIIQRPESAWIDLTPVFA
jgi:N-hydroxyarylamine O-acetyltransferase